MPPTEEESGFEGNRGNRGNWRIRNRKFGKRRRLGKDSFLGKFGVDLLEIDLRQLIGGSHLTVPCTLSSNGYSIKMHALADSGANGFVFIDTACAVDIAKFLNLKAQRLSSSIKVKGYDGKASNSVTHVLRLHLTIDGRRQYNLPLLILDLGSHDLILGRKWFDYFNVLIDCRQRCLQWPSELKLSYSATREIAMPRENLYSSPTSEYDDDIATREKAFQKEDSIAIVSGPTDKLDITKSLKRMSNELLGKTRLEPARYIKKSYPETPQHYLKEKAINISSISAIGMHYNMRVPENEAFTTSLYEIDCRIYELQEPEAEIEDWEEALKKVLLEEYWSYSDAFSKKESDKLPPNRSYDYQIELTEENQLSYSPLYKMTIEELEVVKQYLIDNLAKGFIEPSQAPFASPVLFVKKPNGELRFCIDFRKLNQITRKDQYPLPLIDETLARIGKAKVFTKLDIRQAFHRIRMNPESEELTTFRTRYGSYKCKVLPFSLTNGPATYQRYMNDVLFDYLDDFATAYLDDILIYSEDPSEHQIHVKKVLQRLRDAGLQVDIKKCEFGVPRTKYLGFIISTAGIEVDPDKVSVVQDWKAPNTVRGIQSFLGFCNFYRRFIRDYGKIAKPLVRLTKTGIPFMFDKACWEAFEELKARLTGSEILRHYDPTLQSMIETDASDGVIAGVLSQLHLDKEWYPVAYFSKTMAPAECNYHTHDKEMLAIVKSLDQWRPELQGIAKKIQIFIDYKALEYFMTTKQLTGRQARWAEALAEYYFIIMYRTGKQNAKADALTRRDEEVEFKDGIKAEYRTKAFLSQDQIDSKVLKDLGIDIMPESESEPSISPIELDEPLELLDRLLQSNRQAPSLDAIRIEAQKDENSEFTLEDGLLLYSGRLVVPEARL